MRLGSWSSAGLAYTVIALVPFLWPDPTRGLREIIGYGDVHVFVWNAWWMGESLRSLASPFHTDMIFAPEGATLVWHTFAPLPSALVALLATALPLHVAFNAVTVAAYPLAGLSARALCRRFVDDPAACFLGGLAFMACPYMTARGLGHFNMLFCGGLPLFLALLLDATEPGAEAHARGSTRWTLAFVSLALLLSALNAAAFAANLGFAVLVWRAARERPLRAVLGRFARAAAPSIVVCAPYGLVLLGYAIAWDAWPIARRDLAWNPEPLAFLLPFTETSVWSEYVLTPRLRELGDVEPAVYLGWGVGGLAILGFTRERARPEVRLLAGIAVTFAVLSLGSKLLWQRSVVQVAGVDVPLPFGLWRHVPLLGGVGQAGRYAVLTYTALAAGLALGVRHVRGRVPRRWRSAIAIGFAALVLIDYAARPVWSPPATPLPLEHEPAGRVLDPRPHAQQMMSEQRLHGRPLIGGVIARPPRRVLEAYRRDPGLRFFFGDAAAEAARFDAASIAARLAELDVSHVVLAPEDPRCAILEAHGFTPIERRPDRVVYRVPRGSRSSLRGSR